MAKTIATFTVQLFTKFIQRGFRIETPKLRPKHQGLGTASSVSGAIMPCFDEMNCRIWRLALICFQPMPVKGRLELLEYLRQV